MRYQVAPTPSPLSRVAAGEFEEGEDADLGNALGLFDEADLSAEFGVADAVVGWAAMGAKLAVSGRTR